MVELVNNGLIQIAFHLDDQINIIDELLTRCSNIPMTFTDARLVCVSKNFNNATIWKIDGDFQLFRKHRRQIIPIIIPPPKK